MEDCNVLWFFKNTYEELMSRSANEDTEHRRPHNMQVPYLSNHPSHNTLQRVVRSCDTNNLVNFVGPWFARRDDPENGDYFYASMILLFRAWRHIETDLKRVDETWQQSFMRMENAMTRKEQQMLDNIQYYYHCKKAADIEKETDPGGEQGHMTSELTVPNVAEENDEIDDDEAERPAMNRELYHGQLAVEAGKLIGLFMDNEDDKDNCTQLMQYPVLRNATEHDSAMLNIWHGEMDHSSPDGLSTRRQLSGETGARVEPESIPEVSSATLLHHDTHTPTFVDTRLLDDDQLQAYEIVRWHVERNLAGNSSSPLRMKQHKNPSRVH